MTSVAWLRLVLGCLTSSALHGLNLNDSTLNSTIFSRIIELASAVVFYRFLHEWEVGTEPAFAGGIGYPQPFSIILSHVYAELKLQRGWWIF